MKVAVVGATGLVGSRMLEVLAERDFPVSELYPVASERSIGKTVRFKGREYPVMGADEAIVRKPALALFSAGGAVSGALAPRFADAGCRVIDNSARWRMDPDKKLVVPEINGDVIEEEDMIVANPNCSTIQMVLPLAPLHKALGVKRVVVSTYQSVTGAGYRAIGQMNAERAGARWGTYDAKFHCPIDQNVIPHIDVFLDNGYTKEETKMMEETKKILGDGSIAVTATTVRVPVQGGHSESVNVELARDFTIDGIRSLMASMPGVTIQDDPGRNVYPMPLYAWGKDDVFVGRIRRDDTVKYGVNFWCVSDNIRKGAATNAVQIAQLMLDKGFLPAD